MGIDEIREVVAPLCRQFAVRRLDAFGPIARGSASSSSDVDLLVALRDRDRSPAKRFFGLLKSEKTAERAAGAEGESAAQPWGVRPYE